VNPYTLCPVGEHNPRAPRRWLFPTPKGVARACQRNLSLYDEALEDRGRYRPKPSLPSALGSRLDPDGEGGQLVSQMAMAPGGRSHFDRPDWRKCAEQPDCGCWVCLDKAGVPLAEAREPEERSDQKQNDQSLVAGLAKLSPLEYDCKRDHPKGAGGTAQAVRDIPASIVGWRRQGTEGVCPPCPRKRILLLPTPSSMCRCVGNPTAAGTSSLFSMCRRTLLPTH